MANISVHRPHHAETISVSKAAAEFIKHFVIFTDRLALYQRGSLNRYCYGYRATTPSVLREDEIACRETIEVVQANSIASISDGFNPGNSNIVKAFLFDKETVITIVCSEYIG